MVVEYTYTQMISNSYLFLLLASFFLSLSLSFSLSLSAVYFVLVAVVGENRARRDIKARRRNQKELSTTQNHGRCFRGEN